jgi:nitrate/TMAO reductase-like tetraheme cytochrome c subunit
VIVYLRGETELREASNTTRAVTTMIPAILILSAVVIIALATHTRKKGRSRGPRPRRSYAFLVMFVLPALWIVGALAYADTATRSTSFCLKCHEMEPYGESVTADNATTPATHYRNEWVDRETACYVCHTTPGLSGYVVAKAKGLRDVFVHFAGEVPEEIHLDAPYDAGICLSCHAGDDAFLALEAHRTLAEASPGDDVTCAGCHAVAHALAD